MIILATLSFAMHLLCEFARYLKRLGQGPKGFECGARAALMAIALSLMVWSNVHVAFFLALIASQAFVLMTAWSVLSEERELRIHWLGWPEDKDRWIEVRYGVGHRFWFFGFWCLAIRDEDE